MSISSMLGQVGTCWKASGKSWKRCSMASMSVAAPRVLDASGNSEGSAAAAVVILARSSLLVLTSKGGQHIPFAPTHRTMRWCECGSALRNKNSNNRSISSSSSHIYISSCESHVMTNKIQSVHSPIYIEKVVAAWAPASCFSN